MYNSNYTEGNAVAQEKGAQNMEVFDEKRFKLACTLLTIDVVVNVFMLIQAITLGRFSMLLVIMLPISAVYWAGLPYGWQKANHMLQANGLAGLLIKVVLAQIIGWVYFLKAVIQKVSK